MIQNINLVLNVKYERTQIHDNGGLLAISYLVESQKHLQQIKKNDDLNSKEILTDM